MPELCAKPGGMLAVVKYLISQFPIFAECFQRDQTRHAMLWIQSSAVVSIQVCSIPSRVLLGFLCTCLVVCRVFAR